MIQWQVCIGTGESTVPIPLIPHGNFIGKFRCGNRERRFLVMDIFN
jgi:hypothetical protein